MMVIWKLHDRSQMLVSKAYPKNEEYNTMLQVIGLSVTIEYSLKMIYENTIGRVFGWIANESLSEKEQTIIDAHRAYSDFIYHTAWYEFEFIPWIGKAWKASESNESSWLRKWERTLFLTIEYSFKAVYAQLIDWAAQASYEEPVSDIYLLISTDEIIMPTQDIKIIKEQDKQKIISITRWGAFTNTVLDLCEQNIEIKEIGGNDEIVVSVLLNKTQQLDFKNLKPLYESVVVTDSDISRLVCMVHVKDLLPFLLYAKNNSIEVEHLYDY